MKSLKRNTHTDLAFVLKKKKKKQRKESFKKNTHICQTLGLVYEEDQIGGGKIKMD